MSNVCAAHPRLYSRVNSQRSRPYIFRTSTDDVLIVGERDIKNNPLNHIIADCLRGDSLHTPLFNKWRPLYLAEPYNMQNCFIGDETKGDYAYLLAVADSTGQIAIAKVEGGDNALLPTTYPVPMPSPDKKITIIATESGFTNEQTFHTNFKQITGLTPRQWLSQTTESTKES